MNEIQTVRPVSQNPKKDVYKDTPIRFLGYSNEVGTAVSELCAGSKGFVRSLPVLSYIPAVLYIGADTFDKYKKGEDGSSTKPSIKSGVREFISQCATSVLLPTGVILGTKKVARQAAKTIGPHLPEKAKTAVKNTENFLKTNKVTSKVFSQKGMPAKFALAALSMSMLVAVTKPIDNLTEKVLETFIDPLLKIGKHGSKAQNPEQQPDAQNYINEEIEVSDDYK